MMKKTMNRTANNPKHFCMNCVAIHQENDSGVVVVGRGETTLLFEKCMG